MSDNINDHVRGENSEKINIYGKTREWIEEFMKYDWVSNNEQLAELKRDYRVASVKKNVELCIKIIKENKGKAHKVHSPQSEIKIIGEHILKQIDAAQKREEDRKLFLKLDSARRRDQHESPIERFKRYQKEIVDYQGLDLDEIERSLNQLAVVIGEVEKNFPLIPYVSYSGQYRCIKDDYKNLGLQSNLEMIADISDDNSAELKWRFENNIVGDHSPTVNEENKEIAEYMAKQFNIIRIKVEENLIKVRNERKTSPPPDINTLRNQLELDTQESLKIGDDIHNIFDKLINMESSISDQEKEKIDQFSFYMEVIQNNLNNVSYNTDLARYALREAVERDTHHRVSSKTASAYIPIVIFNLDSNTFELIRKNYNTKPVDSTWFGYCKGNYDHYTDTYDTFTRELFTPMEVKVKDVSIDDKVMMMKRLANDNFYFRIRCDGKTLDVCEWMECSGPVVVYFEFE